METLQYKGYTVEMEEQAYIDSKNTYKANGTITNKNGVEVDVYVVWDITNPDAENQDERCDWDDFDVMLVSGREFSEIENED